jgi:hypothetical protein
MLNRPFAITPCLLFAASRLLAAGNVDAKPVPPIAPTVTARVVEANYCFARVRGLLPERLPAPPLVLQLRFQVSYHDAGSRPLILPLDHELEVFTALKPGAMKLFAKPAGLFDPVLKVMTHLPPDVSPDSPVNPANNVFAVIPAGGVLTVPVLEELTVPIYKKSLRKPVDLRGHRLYVRLQFNHQPISKDLEAALSDRWARFGVPWSGSLRTETLVFDVPASPQAAECVDSQAGHTARPGL